jgi:hypothetical protein
MFGTVAGAWTGAATAGGGAAADLNELGAPPLSENCASTQTGCGGPVLSGSAHRYTSLSPRITQIRSSGMVITPVMGLGQPAIANNTSARG